MYVKSCAQPDWYVGTTLNVEHGWWEIDFEKIGKRRLKFDPLTWKIQPKVTFAELASPIIPSPDSQPPIETDTQIQRGFFGLPNFGFF